MSELIHHSVGEKIQIETLLHARWWTRCGINQMENVILNVPINARDAMPGGGRQIVETFDRQLDRAPSAVADFVPGSYVALSMRDSGNGCGRQSSGYLRMESRPSEGTAITILMPRTEEVT